MRSADIRKIPLAGAETELTSLAGSSTEITLGAAQLVIAVNTNILLREIAAQLAEFNEEIRDKKREK
jgi:hypothetical protein